MMFNRRSLVTAVLVTSMALSSNTFSKPIDNPEFTDLNVSQEGAVVVVKIDMPPMNSVSPNVFNGFNAVLDYVTDNDTVGAIVVTGRDDVFSLGGGRGGKPPAGLSMSTYAHQTFERMERFPLPIISAINGGVGQGGLEFAMATDIRIAGKSARFSQEEVMIGIIPGFGGVQRLPDLVGRSMAVDMMISGRVLNGEEALTHGLISRLTEDHETVNEAMILAAKLAEVVPTSSLVDLKIRLAESRDQNFTEAMKSDSATFDKAVGSPEMAEALKTFLKRRGLTCGRPVC